MEETNAGAIQAGRLKRGTQNPQPLCAAQIPGALLRLSTATALAGMSESTLRRRAAADPDFPGWVKAGKRCTRLQAGPFLAWLESLKGAS